MRQRLGKSMRIPIFVPLLLMILAVGLFAFDITAVVNATRDPVSYHVDHADDDKTFIAAILTPLDTGEELRSPDAGGWIISRPDHRGDIRTLSGEDPPPFAALLLESRYLIIPASQVEDLAAGNDVEVLHETESLDGLRFVASDAPPDRSGTWHDRLALVWLHENTTNRYGELSATMLEQGGDSIPEMYAVDGSVVARDPWLRGTAVAAAAVALVLAVLPRSRTAVTGLPDGPAGASVELAAMGRGFLTSLRNAHMALATAVLLLGIPLFFSIGLFAKNATGPAGHLEFIGTGDPWEGTVWLQSLFLLTAGVLAAARPALDAHLALRRWRRLEDSAPVEGGLA